MPIDEYVKGRLMTVSFNDGAEKIFGVGTSLRTFSVDNNLEGVYGVGEGVRTPVQLKPLQFSGEFEIETYLVIEALPDLRKLIIGDDNLPPVINKAVVYTADAIGTDQSVSSWKKFELQNFVVRSIDISSREGEAVRVTIRGFYRKIVTGTATSPVLEIDPNSVKEVVCFAGATFNDWGTGINGAIRAMSLSLDSGMERIDSLGVRYYAGVRPGRVTIRGDVTIVPKLADMGGIAQDSYNALNDADKPHPVGWDGTKTASFVFKAGSNTKTITLSGVEVNTSDFTGEPTDVAVLTIGFMANDITVSGGESGGESGGAN